MAFLVADCGRRLPHLQVVRPRFAAGADSSTFLITGLPWGTLRALVLRGLNGDGVPGGRPGRPDAHEGVVLRGLSISTARRLLRVVPARGDEQEAMCAK